MLLHIIYVFDLVRVYLLKFWHLLLRTEPEVADVCDECRKTSWSLINRQFYESIG